MEIETIIETILDGNCILFCGAGASVSALNIKGENFKSAFDLTKLLYDSCGLESDGNLSYAADEFIDHFGEFKLIDLLKEQYTANSILDANKIIGSVEWKRIYTTNYDNVLEKSYSLNGKVLTPVTLSDKPYNYKDQLFS